MMDATRRLEAAAEEGKRLLRAAGQLEDGMRALAEKTGRLREADRLREQLSRVEAKVRKARAGEQKEQKVQLGFLAGYALGQLALRSLARGSKSTASGTKSLSEGLVDLAKPVPVGEVRVVIFPDGYPDVLELSRSAREGMSEDEIVATLIDQGYLVVTWEEFATKMKIRIRQLEASKLVARPLFELHRPPGDA